MTKENCELQVGVKVLLQNPEGKYLLLHRSPEKYPEVSQRWDIVGGRIDPGTPLIGNLEREIKEETKLHMTSEPKLVAAQDILRVTGKHVVRLTYVAETEGEPQLDAEHSDYGWFTLDEIKKLADLDIYFGALINEGRIGT